MKELFYIQTIDNDLHRLQEELFEQADENGEVSDAALEDYDTELKTLLKGKYHLIEAVLVGIQEADALAESHKAIAKKYTDRAKTLTSRNEKLKSIILDVLDGEPFEGENIIAKPRISQRCNIDDFQSDCEKTLQERKSQILEDLNFNENFVDIVLKISKTEVKKLLKKDIKIEGCELDENESLTIRLK